MAVMNFVVIHHLNFLDYKNKSKSDFKLFDINSLYVSTKIIKIFDFNLSFKFMIVFILYYILLSINIGVEKYCCCVIFIYDINMYAGICVISFQCLFSKIIL